MVFFLACALFLLGVFLPSAGLPFWASLVAAGAAFFLLLQNNWALVLRRARIALFWRGAPLDARRVMAEELSSRGAELRAKDSGARLAGLLPHFLRFAKGAGLALLVVIGTAHYNLDNYRYEQKVAEIAGSQELRGIVITDPRRGLGSQSFYLRALGDQAGARVLVRTSLDTEYFYGDELLVFGLVRALPQGSYGRYLVKERIHAVLSYPRIERVSSGRGNIFIAAALRAKHDIQDTFRKVFDYQEAALMSGVTIAATEDFSVEFMEKLSWSGTMHLMAASGQNLTIIIAIVWSTLAYFLPKRLTFLLTLLVVFVFTAMTGFQVSAIRAAIMGMIAWVAREMIGRPHAVHNAMALAAAGLVAFNPKILVFDIGFQLSFLATAAIIYLAPALRRDKHIDIASLYGSALGPGRDAGFLNWRESLWVTVAAQLAVAPILISTFQNFSLMSFAANILILPVIPIVMTIGFLVGIAGMIFDPLAQALAFVIYPLVGYTLFLIDIFAELTIAFNPQLGLAEIIAYYALLTFVAWKFYKKGSL